MRESGSSHGVTKSQTRQTKTIALNNLHLLKPWMQKDSCETTCEFSAEWSQVRLPNLRIFQGATVLCLSVGNFSVYPAQS